MTGYSQNYSGPGSSGPGRLVRPYTLTGGRTRSGSSDLPLEAIVVTTDRGRLSGADLVLERRRIITLCAQPQSVAELSTLLGVPLGVTRVLVTDLMREGLVAVNDGARHEETELDLLGRVLNGIRAL